MNTIFIQIIGFTGLAFYTLSFQMKSNKWLMSIQLVSNLLYAIQFLILDGWAGCINTLLAIARNLMILQSSRWKWLSWMGWAAVLSAAGLAATIINWNGFISIFPFLSIASSNFFYWTRNPQKIRLGVLTVISPCFLTYVFFIGSWGGVCNELLSLASILISIYRYGWHNLDKCN